MPTVLDLPPEILVKAFDYLNLLDLRNIEKVCHAWQRLIKLHFWRTHIQKLTTHNQKLLTHLETLGWTHDCMDLEIIEKVWLKLQSPSRWEISAKCREELLYEYAPRQTRMKVSSCVLFKDKLFVSMIGGNVHSRSSFDFSLRKVLRDIPFNYNEEEPILLTTPIAIHGNILVGHISSEETLYLWNAETEEVICQISLPQSLRKIYDVRITKSHIICLASWSLVAWTYVRQPDETIRVQLGPKIFHDCYDDSEDSDGVVNVWFETHNLEVNEQFAITHASQPLLAVYREGPNAGGSKSRSFLHCRRLCAVSGLGQMSKLNEEQVFQMEIGAISLSPERYNILAISVVDEEMCFRYIVKLIAVPSGEILSHVFDTKYAASEVRIPISWVDNMLFMKLAPRMFQPSSIPGGEDVTLTMWNCETKQEISIDDVQLVSISDMLMIDHANVVQLYHRFARVSLAEVEENITNEIHGKVYDFWNTV